jgi:hypothetical protein
MKKQDSFFGTAVSKIKQNIKDVKNESLMHIATKNKNDFQYDSVYSKMFEKTNKGNMKISKLGKKMIGGAIGTMVVPTILGKLHTKGQTFVGGTSTQMVGSKRGKDSNVMGIATEGVKFRSRSNRKYV